MLFNIFFSKTDKYNIYRYEITFVADSARTIKIAKPCSMQKDVTNQPKLYIRYAECALCVMSEHHGVFMIFVFTKLSLTSLTEKNMQKYLLKFKPHFYRYT